MTGLIRLTVKAALYIGGALLLVGGVLRGFFMQPLELHHSGMAPTIAAGETVLLWKGKPEIGDVTVCEHPQQPGLSVVGRLVAAGGEVTVREDGIHAVDGERPDVDWEETVELVDPERGTVTYRIAEASYGDTSFGHSHRFMAEQRRRPSRNQRRRNQRLNRNASEVRSRTFDVDLGTFFLLGDNRAAPDHDSRTFGAVDPATCLGSIVMRWKPTNEGETVLGHAWLDPID